MGHPNSSFTLGIPFASSDGKFYSRYPQGNAIGTPGNASGALTAVSAAAPSGAASSPTDVVLLNENFDSYANGFNLYGGPIDFDQLEPNSIKVSTDFPFSGANCVKFIVGSNVTTKQLNGDLGGNYREVTVEYRLRFPAGYKHFNLESSSNNKFFRLWGSDNPGDPDDRGHSYDTDWGKLGLSTEPGSGGVDYSDIYPEWTDNIGVYDFTQHDTPAVNIIGPPSADTYRLFKIYCKRATPTTPAILQMWVDGVLKISEQPANYQPFNVQSYRYLYWFGSRNSDDDFGSGHTPTMNIYMDDVKVTVKA